MDRAAEHRACRKAAYRALSPAMKRWIQAGRQLIAVTAITAIPVIAPGNGLFDARRAGEWHARGAAPEPAAAEDGVRFDLPFRPGVDRFYWDRDFQADWSAITCFELEIECPDPEAVRALYLYFQSGGGWYIGRLPLTRPGRQTLVLSRQEMETENRAGGWDGIRRLRLSPWKGADRATHLTVYSLRPRTARLALFYNPDCPAAERSAQRLSRWLRDLGLPHLPPGPQEDLPRAPAEGVAILLHPAGLTETQYEFLEHYSDSGGRLVIFYSPEEELARLMGFRPGRYLAAEDPGRWSAMTFRDPEERHVPRRVRQQSWNIHTVYPDRPGTEVIAQWEQADGTLTGDPAWLQSPHGLWMTHIPLGDDVRRKRRMLLGLLAGELPELWPAAARRAVLGAGQIDSFADFEAGEPGLAPLGGRGGPQAELLDNARRLHHRLQQEYAAGRFAETVSRADRLNDLLVRAYAAVQRPAADEFRGVWDHSGLGLYPGDWERTCRELAAAGVTAVFPNIAWGGLAHYASDVLPRSEAFNRFGDQLEQCIAAARRYGLEVHAWKICWNLEGAPADWTAVLARDGRVLSAAGTDWLCPAHPDNQALELEAAAELLERYDIDGLHLDYIRYPAGPAAAAPGTRRHFERATRRAVNDWPDCIAAGGAHHEAFLRWRSAELTGLVESIRELLRGTRPEARLSAAVFGDYPASVRGVGQDWGQWLQRGLLDFASPMNYTEDGDYFRRLLRRQSQMSGAGKRLFPGIGVTSSRSTLLPGQVVEQVLAVRRAGLPGYLLFDLDHTLAEDILPLLSPEPGVAGE